MNTKAVLNIRVDKQLKHRAQATAKALGVPLSVVVNASLRKLVDERQVVIGEPLTPNKATRKILDEALRDIKKGKNMVGRFTNAEDFIRSLKD